MHQYRHTVRIMLHLVCPAAVGGFISCAICFGPVPSRLIDNLSSSAMAVQECVLWLMHSLMRHSCCASPLTPPPPPPPPFSLCLSLFLSLRVISPCVCVCVFLFVCLSLFSLPPSHLSLSLCLSVSISSLSVLHAHTHTHTVTRWGTGTAPTHRCVCPLSQCFLLHPMC